MVDSILSYEPCEEEDYYGLLGCHETSNTDQINTEFKLRALKEHPDKNVDNEHSSGESFKRLQTAREVLTDPVKRQNYDKWRNSGMAISYSKWKALGESARATMHWATAPKTKPMIKSEEQEHQQSKGSSNTTRNTASAYVVGDVVWERRQGNDLLRKFRNYEV